MTSYAFLITRWLLHRIICLKSTHDASEFDNSNTPRLGENGAINDVRNRVFCVGRKCMLILIYFLPVISCTKGLNNVEESRNNDTVAEKLFISALENLNRRYDSSYYRLMSVRDIKGRNYLEEEFCSKIDDVRNYRMNRTQ